MFILYYSLRLAAKISWTHATSTDAVKLRLATVVGIVEVEPTPPSLGPTRRRSPDAALPSRAGIGAPTCLVWFRKQSSAHASREKKSHMHEALNEVYL